MNGERKKEMHRERVPDLEERIRTRQGFKPVHKSHLVKCVRLSGNPPKTRREPHHDWDIEEEKILPAAGRQNIHLAVNLG